LTHARSDHAAVRQFPYAHREIYVLFHHIHVPIGELQSHPDIWKGAQKFQGNPQNMAAGAVMLSSP
jgi:hypothetical protein